MQFSYFHVAAEVPEGPLPDVAVVIDVLRATTTMAYALENGADSVHVFDDLDELRRVADEWPQPLRLLFSLWSFFWLFLRRP